MADIDVHYGPVTVVAEPITVTVQGLDDTTNTIRLETPQPVKAETKAELIIKDPIKIESKAELAITEPIRTETRADLDIKPVALDQCLNIRLGPLPPTCIRQPYQLHLGLTLFGIEIFGVSLSGESQVLVSELATRPQVAWGGEQALVAPADPPAVAPAAGAGGAPVRIRLGP